MIWDETRILEVLRQAYQAGENLSYNAMARQHQSLVSAAAYHFGSYRQAVRKAGIDYKQVVRRPRWTCAAIIALIKQAHRRGEDLHWGAVTKRRDELGRAAFASLQPRLFGRWDCALLAAGINPASVSRYRTWEPKSILKELKNRLRSRQALNSGTIQKEDPGLHAAAIRHFGAFDDALRSAKIDPRNVRQRRHWTAQEVLLEIRKANREGLGLSGTAIRKDNLPLHGAAVRLFGSFRAARDKAGVSWHRNGKKNKRIKTAAL